MGNKRYIYGAYVIVIYVINGPLQGLHNCSTVPAANVYIYSILLNLL